jgi:dTDP-4-dehydrorhamnose reductase
MNDNILPETEEQLDDLMTRPTVKLTDSLRGLRGPLLVLGGSGKMGPTLAVLARRAAPDLEVVAVSRFSDPDSREWLERRGVRTISCDLMERAEVAALPDSDDIIYMAGRKFGTTGSEALTWGMNTIAPALVAERYPASRIVALSTGCVYPLVPVEQGGSCEEDPLTPIGEYSNACVARERIFEYYSGRNNTPMVMVRLNYAIDLRYGVLLDIAQRVYRGDPVDVTMGYLNCIWQGDANEMILRSLDLASSPPLALNLTGMEILSVRELAVRFGELLGREAVIVGEESSMALLSDPGLACRLLGLPATPLETMMRRTANWLQHGGRTLGKPTHFEVSDGRY